LNHSFPLTSIKYKIFLGAAVNDNRKNAHAFFYNKNKFITDSQL
jgi:hypothetical protein